MFPKAPSNEGQGMGASWKLITYFNNEDTLLAFSLALLLKLTWLLPIQIFQSLVSCCSVCLHLAPSSLCTFPLKVLTKHSLK